MEVKLYARSVRLLSFVYLSLNLPLGPAFTDYRNMSTEHLLGDISVILDALIGVDNTQRQE